MRIGIAAITSTALIGGTLVAVPAHPLLPITAVAQAQEAPIATAEGQVLDLSLLSDVVDPADEAAFASLLDAIRANAQFPGNTTDSANLDLSLLQTIDVTIGGVSLPLTDLLGIDGPVGVLGANASTPAGNSASASAGALNDDGSIDLSAHQGGNGVETTLDLTDILGTQDLLTQGIIDELALRIGAASVSAQTDGTEVTSEYALANVGLSVNSPLIADLVDGLTDPTDGLGVQVDNLVAGVAGEQGLVNGILGALGGVLALVNSGTPTVQIESKIQETLQTLLTGQLVSTSGAVTIDLATGEVYIDVDALGGTSAVDPNTNLLDQAATAQIANEINDLLQGLLDNVDAAINDALLESAVTVNLQLSLLLPVANVTIDGTLNQLLSGDRSTINVALLGVPVPGLDAALIGALGLVGGVVEDAIEGAVSPIVNTVLNGLVGEVVSPLADGLGSFLADTSILALTLNDQPNPQIAPAHSDAARPNSATGVIQNPDEKFTVSALRVTALGGLLDLPIARATVQADADWVDAVAPTLADIADQTITLGDSIADVTPEATPDDAVITATGLPVGVTITDGVISGTPTAAGTSQVTVTATNSAGTVSTTFSINVNDADVDVAPVIDPIGDKAGTVGEAITEFPVVVAPDTANVEVEGLPDGVTYNPVTGVISGTPTQVETVEVTVTATNDGLTDTETFAFTVVDAAVVAPEITPIDDQNGVEGDPIEDIIVEVTPDEAEVEVEGLPEGLEYNEDTGVIEGTPAPGTEDSHTVTVTATNDGVTVTEVFIINITAEDDGNGGGDGSSDVVSGSSDFLQKCLNSPAAPIAALLLALGTVGNVAGPAFDPIAKSINAEIDRQMRNLNMQHGASQPQWLRQLNASLNRVGAGIDSRTASNAIFATGVLALLAVPLLCGMGGSGSSES